MSKVGARRRRAFVTAALVVLIVAVPLGVFAWGRTSGTFRVRHIVLSGARPTHTKALDRVLQRRFLGANLFLVTSGRVRAALSGFPFVFRVSVNRDFPGTLRVHMSEYVPAALLSSGGLWYVVSKEGRVLAAARVKAAATGTSTPGASAAPGTTATTGTSVSPSPGASPTPGTSASPDTGASPGTSTSPGTGATGQSSTTSPSTSSTSIPHPATNVKLPRGTRTLPVIVTTTPLAVGKTVVDPLVRAALTVLGALPAALRRDVLGAGATDTSVRVYVASGPTVEFGGTTRLTAKVLALRAVLGRYRARGVTCTFVDVSVPDRPLAAPLLSPGSTQSSATTPTPGPSSSTTQGTPTTTPAGTPTSAP